MLSVCLFSGYFIVGCPGKFFAKSSLSRPTDREATSAEDIKAFFVDYHRKKKQEAEEAAAEQAELENGDTGAEDNTREDMEADVPKKLSDADNIGARVCSVLGCFLRARLTSTGTAILFSISVWLLISGVLK